MPDLCQYIAMRANGEDGTGLGRFWQGRYKAVRILDEESLGTAIGFTSVKVSGFLGKCVGKWQGTVNIMPNGQESKAVETVGHYLLLK